MSPELRRAYDALEQADAAGNTEDAQQIADYIRELEAQESKVGDMTAPIAGAAVGTLTGAVTGPTVGKAVDVAVTKAAEKVTGPKGTPRGDSVAKWLATQTTGPNVGGATFEEAYKKSEIARGKPVQSRGSNIPMRRGFLGIENQPAPPSLPQKAAANLIAGEKLGTPSIPRRIGGMGVAGAEAGKMVSDIERGDPLAAIISGIGSAGGVMSQSRIKPIRAIGTGLSILVPGAQGASAVKDIISPSVLEEEEKKAEGGLIQGYAKGKRVISAAKDLILPPAENAARTQIIGTLPTYAKAAEILKQRGAAGRGIDVGAGLGEGSKILGKNFDTMEPYAKGWKPTYTSAEQMPSDAYGQLTNLNVLNVMPREARDELVKHIGRTMEPGGLGVLTTRGADVMKAQGRPGPEEMSMITSRDTYQKGFTKQELEDYLRYILGEKFDVNKLNLGPAGAVIQKKAKGGEVFDPEGSGYDYKTALAYGMGPDGKGEDLGHWGSVAPTSDDERMLKDLPRDSYVMLKGKAHETFKKAEEAEKKRGSKTVKSGERYYSVPEYAKGGSTTPAWQRKEGKSPSGGLNAVGRASYKRETGGELKAPQPEGGSRKKSFCARMGGMKKKLTSSKTANDPDSRINKALRKWKC